jgi:hypothetical protein
MRAPDTISRRWPADTRRSASLRGPILSGARTRLGPPLVLIALVASCRDEPHRAEPAKPSAPAVARPSASASSLVTAEAIPTGAPYVPSQCYTKTQSDHGRIHNPCFTCHADAAAPNYIADSALQLSYAFGPASRVNPWTNLFVDRSAEVAAIHDDDMLTYVRHDNYSGSAEAPGLSARLASPNAWDGDGDGRWSGWTPDIAFHFDDGAFDVTPDGGYTGWRAYGYYPLPGTFWPTNGSSSDAMIRLPAAFREDRAGHFDRTIYVTNFAILESLITRADVPIDPTDEQLVGVDLDGDGHEGRAVSVRYRWKPGGGGMSWAGRASALQARGEIHLAAGLFPEGTEFAHSVRYLDVEGGRVRMAARMKELRYMVKQAWTSYGTLEHQATSEAAEKQQSPHKTRPIVGNAERGIGNRVGWRIQGFIEDASGELRPQTLAEHAFCIGCHSGVGVTDDSVFSFGRKLSAERFQRGWFHEGQRGLEGVPEPVRADGRGEYTFYLEQNGAGDELRANQEVVSRFFDASGALKPDMAARVHRDVSVLLLPSPERALQLDKAYRVIVQEQSFVHGRDATVTPAVNVHRELPEPELATGVTLPILDRRRASRPVETAAKAAPRGVARR